MGLQGYQSTRRSIESIRDNLGDNVHDAVKSATEETAAEAKRQVAMWDAIWTRDLYGSIGATWMRWDTDVRRYKIQARQPYAKYVEYGTGLRGENGRHGLGGYASPSESDFGTLFGNILSWVETKPGFIGPRTPSTAAAITHTIIDQGTYAQPFMRPAWHSGEREVLGSARVAMRMTVWRA